MVANMPALICRLSVLFEGVTIYPFIFAISIPYMCVLCVS